jgi:hypothetical protein
MPGRRHWLASAAAMGCGWPMLAARAASPLDAALLLPVLADTDESPERGVFFGIFREDSLPDVLATAESDLRRQPAAAMWFTRFESAFPESQLRFLAQRGTAAQVTWEPWAAGNRPVPLADIVAGRWDAYIDSWATAAARLGLPFMLRFGHEFNGDWYPWCTVHNGRDPALYVRAYRRVVDRFRQAGAHQVQWVWCFNNDSVPAAAWNDPRAAWPGSEYVDWIGIDGYNFGTSRDWSRWTSFEHAFSGAVSLAREIASDKPVVIAETGCSETGGDKAAWIERMFLDLEAMPSVRAFTWFDIVKETSWSLTTSDAAWLAAIHGLRRPTVRGNGRALLSIVPSRRPR